MHLLCKKAELEKQASVYHLLLNLLQKEKKNAVFAIIAFFIALNGIIIAKFVGKIKQFSP